MKKLIASVFMMLICAVALAMPSPKLVEDALAAGNYNSARSMIQQVLAEKPDSARAHLLNAYILIHADHNAVASAQELENARRLDSKGDVKGSPLFGRVVAEIDGAKRVAVVQQPVKPVPQAAPVATSVYQEHPKDWATLWVIVVGISAFGLLAAMLIMYRRERSTTVVYNTPAQRTTGMSTAYESSYSSPRVRYDEPVRVAPVQQAPIFVQPAVQAVAGTGMGAFGTAASVAGGVVAGELLADSLRARRRHEEDEEERLRRERQYQRDNDSTYYSPTPSPSPVSYEPERESFSSSSSRSDSWGSSSSSSSSDSWSSSSSSSDSWSSSDSGSSGGDW
jgi:uncharacterized membrane protein YgcG